MHFHRLVLNAVIVSYLCRLVVCCAADARGQERPGNSAEGRLWSPVVDEGVVVRPDQVSLGVLVNAVPRDAVDDAVMACGVRERRSDGKLPAHVITRTS